MTGQPRHGPVHGAGIHVGVRQRTGKRASHSAFACAGRPVDSDDESPCAHVRPTIMAGMSTRRSRVLRRLIVAGVLGAAVYWFAAPHIRSAALLLDLTGAAPRIRAWLPVSRHDVSSEDVTVPTRTMTIAARVYRPVHARGPALL